RAYGSTLFRKPGEDKGIEPDKSYYVGNEEAVRGRDPLDLDVDPPPDLVVEVVVSHGPEKSLAFCREVGVPEVWIYDVPERRLVFMRWKRTGRRGGSYSPSDTSLTFPFLTVDDAARWLTDDDPDDGSFDRKLRKWVKAELRPRFRP